jgi:hypothetical protein
MDYSPYLIIGALFVLGVANEGWEWFRMLLRTMSHPKKE